ncbi:MAG: flagellar assembly protein FliW [Acidimicrobiales bacterium]|nr:flagellar assembly protein FliW [Acidimicrobiales bacterium]
MTAQRVCVDTERFGPLDIDVEQIIEVPDGFLGFPELRRLVLIPVDDDATFCWMQSVDDPATAFLAVAPWSFFPDYEVTLRDDDADALALRRAEDAVTWCLITVHREPDRFTANLLGPVLVNNALRRGRQVILREDLPTQAELLVG